MIWKRGVQIEISSNVSEKKVDYVKMSKKTLRSANDAAPRAANKQYAF